MTTRNELIARLRKYSLRSGYAIHCHAAADMLEADEKAARLALDALLKKNGKWGQGHDELEARAIATLKELLK